MKTVYMLDDKKVSKKRLQEQLGEDTVSRMTKEAKEGFREDPMEEQSWMTEIGYLVISFN